MKPDQQTTIYIDPQSSGNITKFDYEEAFAQVAAVVPEMDMRASIRFFTNEEGEQVFLSPAGTSQMSDYYPIYCAGCGKEITNDEIFPDEEGVLYCQECAENGFGNDDEELEEDGWDEE